MAATTRGRLSPSSTKPWRNRGSSIFFTGFSPPPPPGGQRGGGRSPKKIPSWQAGAGGGARSGASPQCVPKLSLGTRRTATSQLLLDIIDPEGLIGDEDDGNVDGG